MPDAEDSTDFAQNGASACVIAAEGLLLAHAVVVEEEQRCWGQAHA